MESVVHKRFTPTREAASARAIIAWMDRRTIVVAIGVGFLAGSLASSAQKSVRVWHIGFLSNGPRPTDNALPPAFRQALERLGYVESKNVTFTGRWAEGNSERLPSLAADLVGRDIDVLLTTGAPAAEAAKRATSSIPIVSSRQATLRTRASSRAFPDLVAISQGSAIRQRS